VRLGLKKDTHSTHNIFHKSVPPLNLVWD